MWAHRKKNCNEKQSAKYFYSIFFKELKQNKKMILNLLFLILFDHLQKENNEKKNETLYDIIILLCW